jgi:hypothetical protein
MPSSSPWSPAPPTLPPTLQVSPASLATLTGAADEGASDMVGRVRHPYGRRRLSTEHCHKDYPSLETDTPHLAAEGRLSENSRRVLCITATVLILRLLSIGQTYDTLSRRTVLHLGVPLRPFDVSNRLWMSNK